MVNKNLRKKKNPLLRYLGTYMFRRNIHHFRLEFPARRYRERIEWRRNKFNTILTSYKMSLIHCCFQIENLEDLLKEKDNQVDLAKSKLTQVRS